MNNFPFPSETVHRREAPVPEEEVMQIEGWDDKLMGQLHKITGQEERPHFHLHHLYAETTNWEQMARVPSHGIPRIMHYVWCEQKSSFTFNHFLSVLSVIRTMVPDSIYLYYETGNYPTLDEKMYNTWLEELRYNFPWLITEPQNNTKICSGSIPNEYFVMSKLRKHGGAFMDFSIAMVEFDESLMPFDFIFEQGPQSYGIIGSKPNFPFEVQTYDQLKRRSENGKVFQCPDAQPRLEGVKNYICLRLVDPLFPEILLKESAENVPFYRYMRKLFYGNEGLPEVKTHLNEVVPNNGHYVWFGGGKMDYIFYLSALSVLYIVKADVIYVHGDKPPSGMYWERLQKEEGDRVRWVYRQYPHGIYQSYVGRVEHAADVARHDIMLKYGGINMDADVIFTRPLDRRLFHYDTVVTLDNYWYPMRPFPNTFNLGVVMNKPHSKFWQLYQFSERYYYEDDYTWNSNRVPYKIWERNPSLLRIEPELQVICCYLKCYPTWVETRMEAYQLSKNIEAWKDRAMSFHWTWPSPSELDNEQSLRSNNSLFAGIGQNVLKAAGKW
ncbi:hypothetical protein CAPTEDRAFT_217705 [Capitella teleta]|uniref:Nucleotide-diphospho-sugar transferase domain-containing protein n=1 Tax=Capitella teleta TaxID=283909 RepID=X2AMK1_CAPTE|nr:hypothetical protein CAPTEDRAFT_217705 [Capitella teleta]|eukprot:ELU00321.1 hypothetical protein CAPTEDRAFT_217705 [Capitella teleta]